jgi:hypothetical protein
MVVLADSPKLSVAIAGHPKRKHLVDRLRDDYLWGCPVQVAWDEKDEIWDTHERAWNLCRDDDPHATHCLVLQDDALPCKNIVAGLEMALRHLPGDVPVSLYLGNALNHPKIVRSARTADEQKASWIVSTGFWWGVAVLLPKTFVDPMLEFCSPRREPAYDRRLSIWTEYNNYPVFYTWPSFVDHVDEVSLAHPQRKPGRKAYKYAGQEYDALDFIPTGPTVPCGRVHNLQLG